MQPNYLYVLFELMYHSVNIVIDPNNIINYHKYFCLINMAPYVRLMIMTFKLLNIFPVNYYDIASVLSFVLTMTYTDSSVLITYSKLFGVLLSYNLFLYAYCKICNKKLSPHLYYINATNEKFSRRLNKLEKISFFKGEYVYQSNCSLENTKLSPFEDLDEKEETDKNIKKE
jgi:hypothetical protein